MKLTGLLATVAVCCTFLTGCWDYRGLNEQTIVAGMAVDVDEPGEGFFLTFEVVDTSVSPKEQGVRRKLIDTRGPTYLEAIRSSVEGPYPKLYFSNTPIIIISEMVAKKYGIASLVDYILRDDELRETVRILVAKGMKARDAFVPESEDDSLLSYNLMDAVDNITKYAGTNTDIRAYQIYNEINSKMDISFAVPAVILDKDPKGNPIPTLSGGAAFQNNEFKGYLEPELMQPYLIIRNELKGGILSFNLDNNKNNDVVLEVLKCRTSRPFEYKDGELTFFVKPNIRLEISQLNLDMDLMDKKQVEKLKEDIEDILNTRLENAVKTVQQTLKADIFKFCHSVKDRDPVLWGKIGKQWGEIFPNIKVKVETKITIDNSGNIRRQ